MTWLVGDAFMTQSMELVGGAFITWLVGYAFMTRLLGGVFKLNRWVVYL